MCLGGDLSVETLKHTESLSQLLSTAIYSFACRWLEAVTGYWSHAHSESAVNPSAVRAALRHNAHDVALQVC